MAYQYHINRHHHLCYVVLYGTINGDQLAEAVASILNHPEWRTGYNTLWDGSSIKHIVFRLSGIRHVQQAAEALYAELGPGKSAYVATRWVDYLAVTIIKAGMHLPGRETRLFTSLPEARAWLGLTHSTVLPPAVEDEDRP